MRESKRLLMMEPLKRYGYLCLLYLLSSYALAQIFVVGSDLLAEATDRLFAGGAIVLQEFLLPFVVLMLWGGILAAAKSLLRSTFSIDMQTYLRDAIVSKLVKIQHRYFDGEGTGGLMNKLISDIRQTESLFSESLPGVLEGMITVVTLSLYIGMQSVRLLLVTLICYPLLMRLADVLSKQVRKAAKARRQLYDELENVSYDAMQGILVGKSFELYELQKQRIFRIVDKILENESHRTKILGASYVLGYLIGWLPRLFCYLFCLYEVSRGRLTVGAVLAYICLLDRMAGPVGEIPGYIAGIRECAVSLDRLCEVLEQEEELSGMGRFPAEGNRMLELEQVSFGYSEGQEVLKNICLTVNRGSKIAFVGSSGGGKSTVAKLLCGFYVPRKGHVRLYGHDFEEWDIRALRREIALVSQNVFLFPGTIAENVAYGKPGASEEEIAEACRQAKLHDMILQLPQGYETEIGERGAKLSGGQRQRIAIARAFLKDAPILILDEPTSSVDVETEQGIQEALAGLAENRTIIVIAHRLSTIRDADEIYVLEGGEIVEKGAHEQLLREGSVYQTLYCKEAGMGDGSDEGGM